MGRGTFQVAPTVNGNDPVSDIVLADVGAFLDTQFSDDKRAGTRCGGMIRDQFGTGLYRAWDKAGWFRAGATHAVYKPRHIC